MPPRKQPPTLRAAALRAVTADLTYQVRVVVTTSAQPHAARLGLLQEAVSAVPEALRADVVAAALRSADGLLGYRNHPARRVLDKLLAALLPGTTRRLALPVTESFQLRQALLQRVHALPLLRELTLGESLHVHTSLDAAARALTSLPLLTALRAPWLCTDAMLLALAAHCPLLEVVDASESARVTDEGVAALAAGCPALRAANLTGCRVSEGGYRALLVARPHLQRIGRCPGLGHVVRAVGVEVGLVDWDSDHVPGDDDAVLCPNIKAVSLSDVTLLPAAKGENGGAALPLALPAGVQRLRVSWAGLRDHPSRLPLRLSASLTHIDLMDHAVGLAHAVELGRQCPGVRVLKLATLRGDVEAGVAVPLVRADAPFPRLEEFHLYAGVGPVLEYVLLHAVRLRRVSVTCGPPIEAAPTWTDATLRRVLDANPLAELESLVFACPCALTMASVYALLTGCPRLRALHDLGEWAVTQEQRWELRELAAANNWDLELGLI